jgi:hypothetical protein
VLARSKQGYFAAIPLAFDELLYIDVRKCAENMSANENTRDIAYSDDGIMEKNASKRGA